jgi:predicted amidohydrolase YtcJ
MNDTARAETLFYGGTMYTMCEPRPRIEALAVAKGKIIAVGPLDEVEGVCTSATRRVHLGGRTLLPGFNDAHVHIWKVGQLRTTLLDLRGLTSLDDLYRRVSERLAKLGEGEWLCGRGWNEVALGGQPSKEVLSQLAPRNPVVLTRTCAHIHVVNTQALELAKITPDTHVSGSEINFDKGLLAETAYGLLSSVMPKATLQDYRRWIKAGCAYLKTLGITSATDPAVDPPLYEAYVSLEKDNDLDIRVNLLHLLHTDSSSELFLLPPKCDTPYLRCDSVKLFADGGLSGATAALSVPYENVSPKSCGILRYDDEELFELVFRAHEQRRRVGIHAIGDRAIDQVLEICGRLVQQHRFLHRHRIEHFGLPSFEHVWRARQLELSVVTQPIFLRELRQNFERYLPSSFYERCYPLASLEEQHVKLAFSSDGPVVSDLAPLSGIQAAVSEPITPHQGISVATAFHAYTVGGAVAQGDEANRGTLAVGTWADFVELDQDPFCCERSAIDQLQVTNTYVAGLTVTA